MPPDSTPSPSVTTKAPTLLLVISTLIIIVSTLSFLGLSALLFFSSGAIYKTGNIHLGLLLLLVPIAINIASIIVAVGLRRLKKWSLYAFVVVSLVSIMFSVYEFIQASDVGMLDMASVAIASLVLIYVVSIREKFIN